MKINPVLPTATSFEFTKNGNLPSSSKGSEGGFSSVLADNIKRIKEEHSASENDLLSQDKEDV